MESNTEKFNILIVDDRKENLLSLETIIESPELNIIKALSGNEALAIMLVARGRLSVYSYLVIVL